MPFIHTVSLHGNVQGARKSERRYVACIVVTALPAAAQARQNAKARLEVELADWKSTLDARTAKLGMTVEQANDWFRNAEKRWMDTIVDVTTRLERRGMTSYGVGEFQPAVKKEMLAQGLEDPYDQDGAYGIRVAAQQVDSHLDALKRWTPVEVGEEYALSWHGTKANAQKSLSNRANAHYAKSGYKVTVRTDISVRQTQPRVTKGVSR
jgi:hypothetical protein